MKHEAEEKAYGIHLNGTLLYTTFATVQRKTRSQREKTMKKHLVKNEGCDSRIKVSETENTLELHA